MDEECGRTYSRAPCGALPAGKLGPGKPYRTRPPAADRLVSPPLVWISPVSQNYEGPRTAYGDAYHGYWIADATQLNARFGTADDLKALSDALHSRGM